MSAKPPLGLKPKPYHDFDRALDIIDAMRRYVLADKRIPKKWIRELKKLRVKP